MTGKISFLTFGHQIYSSNKKNKAHAKTTTVSFKNYLCSTNLYHYRKGDRLGNAVE